MKDQSQHRQNSLNHHPVIPFAALTQAPVKRVSALLGELDVRGADLSVANLVESNPERADLTDCNILGVSAWNVNLSETIQEDLGYCPASINQLTPSLF